MLEKRILLTDDDPLLQELLEILLCHNGYQLCKAKDGQDALDQVVKGGFNLIILDMMMPVMDGMQFLQRLRQDLQLSIPVLVVTAMNRSGIREELVNLGATDVVFKPIALDDFMKQVQRVLEGADC